MVALRIEEDPNILIHDQPKPHFPTQFLDLPIRPTRPTGHPTDSLSDSLS